MLIITQPTRYFQKFHESRPHLSRKAFGMGLKESFVIGCAKREVLNLGVHYFHEFIYLNHKHSSTYDENKCMIFYP